MERVNLLGNASWQLFALRRTVADLLSYWYQPAKETESTGWRDSVRESVKESFRDAMDVGELVAMIGRDKLTDRRTDALTLAGILHSSAGMTRKELAGDVPNAVKALRDFVASIEAMEHNASDEGERTVEAKRLGADEEKVRQFDAETRALAVMASHPEIRTITDIARQANCSREHLSKNCPRFRAAWDIASESKKRPRRIVRGTKDSKGNQEAWLDDPEIDRELEK